MHGVAGTNEAMIELNKHCSLASEEKQVVNSGRSSGLKQGWQTDSYL